MKHITIQKKTNDANFGNSAKIANITYDEAKNTDVDNLFFTFEMNFFEIKFNCSFIKISNDTIFMGDNDTLEINSNIFHQLSKKYSKNDNFEIEFGDITFTRTKILLKTTSDMRLFNYNVELDIDEKEKSYLSNYFSEVNDEMNEILLLFQ